MKRYIVVIFLLCMAFSLCACVGTVPESVDFYYLRSAETIRYGTEDGFLAPEEREFAGNVETPEAFLSLYFSGPLNSELVSPFPAGTEVENLVLHQDSLILVMNDTMHTLADVDKTVAYACLCATCFSWLDVEEIVVLLPETETQEGSSVTLTRDSFLLLDDSLPAEDSKSLQ